MTVKLKPLCCLCYYAVRYEGEEKTPGALNVRGKWYHQGCWERKWGR